MNPREALKKYLEALAPDYTYTVETLPLDVPGYTFFEGSLDDTPNTRLYWVVRDDGSVVDFGSGEELGRIYQATGILDHPDAASPDALSLMAVCVFVRHQVLVDSNAYTLIAGRYAEGGLAKPELSRTRSGLELVFWTTGIGRNPAFYRHEVGIGTGYAVTHAAKPVRLKLK